MKNIVKSEWFPLIVTLSIGVIYELKVYESKLNLFINKSNLLHQRRLVILSTLYQKLVLLNRTMFEMTRLVKFEYSGDDSVALENKRILDAGLAYNDFSEYFDNNKIYFSKEICDLIVNLKRNFGVVSMITRLEVNLVCRHQN